MPNQKILLIEHDLAVVEATRNPLVGAGYQVEVARDGEAGVEAFRRLQPDLVVVDPLVAKKQGFEVCKEIKQSSGGSDTPVLIATDSYKDSENRQSALSFYGCDEFLERPLSDDALLSLCRRFLVQAAPVPPTPRAAQVKPPSSSGALALDDLDEGEIMERLDSLIDANFMTGDDPEPAETPQPAVAAEPPDPSPPPVIVEPVVAAPAAPTEIKAPPAEVERVAPAPAAAPASHTVASVPVAEPPATPSVKVAETPAALPSIAPDASPATLTGAAPVDVLQPAPSPVEPPVTAAPAVSRDRPVAPPEPVFDIDLPSQEAPAPPSAVVAPLPGASVFPDALPAESIPPVSRTRRGKAPSFLLLGGALAVGLLVVAAIAVLPRWFGGEPVSTATSPASRPVPSPASTAPASTAPAEIVPAETVPPPSSVSPDTAQPAGATPAESTPPTDTASSASSSPRDPRSKRSETPDGFVSPRPVPTQPKQQQGNTPRPIPAAAPPVTESAPTAPAAALEPTPGPSSKSLPDPALEEPYPSPEPVRERFTSASESPAVVDVESLMPAPEAPKPLQDTLFELAEVDVPPISLQRDTPAYPAAARRMRQEGVVELEVLIDFRGKVVDARVTGGKAGSLLNRAALEGARGWSYQPAHEAGVPVRVWKPERVVFKY